MAVELGDVVKMPERGWSPYNRNKDNRQNDNIRTPEALYNALNEEFQFNFDPCPANPDGLREFDGLGDWKERNYVNPPYSEKAKWIEHAIREQKKGNLSVLLLPVDTSTAWFHDLVLPNAEVRFLRGRIKFTEQPAKFASMVCIFRPPCKHYDREEINTVLDGITPPITRCKDCGEILK